MKYFTKEWQKQLSDAPDNARTLAHETSIRYRAEQNRNPVPEEFERKLEFHDAQITSAVMEENDLHLYFDHPGYNPFALKNAKNFEIHCWNEETEWIGLGLKYGKLKEDDWTYGKIITGEVTAEFIEMILKQPKPTDIEAANKMTPFFNVFLDDTFQSSHWGTEIYYGG